MNGTTITRRSAAHRNVSRLAAVGLLLVLSLSAWGQDSKIEPLPDTIGPNAGEAPTDADAGPAAESDDPFAFLTSLVEGRLGNIVAAGVLLLGGFALIAGVGVSALKRYWKLRRDEARKRRGLGEQAQALTEFIIIFPVILLLTTGIIQVSLMKCARMIVNYAAFCAVRSAIVWIPSVNPDPNAPQEEQEQIDYTITANPPDWKMDQVYRAAVLALVPAGSPVHSIVKDAIVPILPIEISDALSDLIDLWTGKFFSQAVPGILNRFLYVCYFSRVLLIDADGDPVDQFVAADREPLSIEVRLAYHLRIPLANAVIGDHLNADIAGEMGWESDPDYPQLTGPHPNYYTVLTERSTLLVERKYVHGDVW